jgi:hypothetical protein
MEGFMHILTDAQLATLLLASPFLLLAAAFAAGGYLARNILA